MKLFFQYLILLPSYSCFSHLDDLVSIIWWIGVAIIWWTGYIIWWMGYIIWWTGCIMWWLFLVKYYSIYIQLVQRLSNHPPCKSAKWMAQKVIALIVYTWHLCRQGVPPIWMCFTQLSLSLLSYNWDRWKDIQPKILFIYIDQTFVLVGGIAPFISSITKR